MLAHATGRVRHFNIKAELARLGLSITPDQHIAAITIDIAHAVGIVGIVTGDDVSRKDMPEPGARSIIGDPDKRRLRSEEHTSELQSLMRISYAVFCLKKKNHNRSHITRK